MTKLYVFPLLIALLLSSFCLASCAQPAGTDPVTVTVPTPTTRPPGTEVPKLKVGDMAPRFTLGDLDNKPVSLADFAGKKVIVNMWMIGCHGCEQELPFLQDFYQKMSGQGVILIGINATNSIALVRGYASTDKLTYTMLVDTGKRLDPSYSITGVPTTFFIDGKGIIKAIKDGAFETEAEIEDVFNSY